MTSITAGAGERAYVIHIAPRLIESFGEFLAPFAQRRRLIVVSDKLVWSLHGARFVQGCKGLNITPILIAPGEKSKSWNGLENLMAALLDAGVDRGQTIIAFGGGVVGDLVGFASSILHRGCGYIQIPTTLLAQVDSSVGGKTGINTAQGKNQVGSFHAPKLVLIDTGLLSSLSPRQLRSGYAEIAKIALIGQPDFFEWLEQNGKACLARDPRALHHAISTAVQGKTVLVNDDELDQSGHRMLLNFGHSFGHAIEAQTSYSVHHGEVVALGIVLAFELSNELGLCDASSVARVQDHLVSVKLPTALSDVGLQGRGQALSQHLRSDKKVLCGAIRFIMTRGIGQAFVDPTLDIERVSQFLAAR